jgi:hypothetical protein
MNWWETMSRFSLREGDPPDDPIEPDPTEPDPTLGGDPPKPEPARISADVLPEELKGLPEAEVKFHLTQLVSGLGNQQQQMQALKDELADLKTNPPAPAEPQEPERPLEEMILEDPEKAVMSVLEKTGLAGRFSRVEEQASESAFTIVFGRNPELSEYEQDVRHMMRESGVPGTVQNITGALQMVVGQKAMEGKGKDMRKAVKPDIPKDEPPKPKDKLPDLTGLEKEIFDSSGMTREEWDKNKSGDFQVEVPLS